VGKFVNEGKEQEQGLVAKRNLHSAGGTGYKGKRKEVIYHSLWDLELREGPPGERMCKETSASKYHYVND